jgi:hypothetical protein
MPCHSMPIKLTQLTLFIQQPDTRQGSLMSSPNILSGADFALNSYMGHEFEIRELPSLKSGGVCTQRDDQTCGNGSFAVSENNEQLITVKKGIIIDFLDDQIRAKLEAKEIIEHCQIKANAKLLIALNNKNTNTNTNQIEIQNSMDALVDCVQGGMTDTLAKANEEINFQTKIRTGMAEMMVRYVTLRYVTLRYQYSKDTIH